MSERNQERGRPRRPSDEDYLWDGSGPADPDLRQVEALAGELRLKAPLVARPRRPWAIAVGAGGLAALIAAWLAPPEAIPPSWMAALLPGVSTDAEVLGGSMVDIALRGEEEPRPEWRRTMAERLEAAGGRLLEDGPRLRAELAGVDREDAAEWLRAVTPTGRLAVKLVVDNSPFMEGLYARVKVDSRAKELGVTGDIDSWEGPEGGYFVDYYLLSTDRAALETYLAEMARRGPELRPPPGTEVALERVRYESRSADPWPASDAEGAMDEPSSIRFENRGEGQNGSFIMRSYEYGGREPSAPVEYWRTHHVRSAAELENRDFAGAYAYRDKWNRGAVIVDLKLDAAQRFADLTARSVGRKLAILLDGRVNSAPVIGAHITDSRLSVSMSGGDRETTWREASALAAVLGSQPLPFSVEVRSATAIPSLVPPAHAQGARGLLALLFGLAVALPVWLLERRARRIDPEVAPVRGRPRRRPLRGKLVVTAIGAALVALADHIPLPGTSELARRLGSEPGGLYGPFALGLVPIFTGYIAVELVVLLVPRWRRLRIGSPAERARLAFPVALVSILVAVAQAYFHATWLTGLDQIPVDIGSTLTVVRDSVVFWRTVAAVAAGSIALAVLAHVIDRSGLGNGFAIVLVAGLAHRLFDGARAIADVSLAEQLALVLGLALTAALTAGILRWRSAGPARFRLPTAGLIPFQIGGQIVSLLIVGSLHPATSLQGVIAWLQELQGRPGLQLVIVLGFGLVLSVLFSRPSRGGAAAAALDPAARRRLWGSFAGATLLSLAYLVALVGVASLLGPWSPTIGAAMLSAAFATAAIMDVVADGRAWSRRDDLAPVWALHQVQRVAPIVDALTRNGIDVHARGLYWRSLLHFFGPFAPIVLHVPSPQRAEAAAIIRTQLGLVAQSAESAEAALATLRRAS